MSKPLPPFRLSLSLQGRKADISSIFPLFSRQSGNSEDFVIEHVIVGVLLLTPLLFLMPTVLVYHAFWALVFLALKVRTHPRPSLHLFFSLYVSELTRCGDRCLGPACL